MEWEQEVERWKQKEKLKDKFLLYSADDAADLADEQHRYSSSITKLREAGVDVSFQQLAAVVDVAVSRLALDLWASNVHVSRAAGASYFLLWPVIEYTLDDKVFFRAAGKPPYRKGLLEERLLCPVDDLLTIVFTQGNTLSTDSFMHAYETWRDKHLRLKFGYFGHEITFESYRSKEHNEPPTGERCCALVSDLLQSQILEKYRIDESNVKAYLYRALDAVEDRVAELKNKSDKAVTHLIKTLHLHPLTEVQRNVLDPSSFFERAFGSSHIQEERYQRELIKIHFNQHLVDEVRRALEFQRHESSEPAEERSVYDEYLASIQRSITEWTEIKKIIKNAREELSISAGSYFAQLGNAIKTLRMLKYIANILPAHKEWFEETFTDVE